VGVAIIAEYFSVVDVDRFVVRFLTSAYVFEVLLVVVGVDETRKCVKLESVLESDSSLEWDVQH